MLCSGAVPRPVMRTSRALLSHWRACPAGSLRDIHEAAQRSVVAFSRATKKSGSLVQEWLGGASMVEYDHYPEHDVSDRRTGYQFYYHAHRHAAQEHGHLHLFRHATRSGNRRFLPSDREHWVRTAPTHLLAISLDARGLPLALFTVNQWVTEGYWFDAQTTMRMIEGFSVGHRTRYAQSCIWLNGFIRMYRPLIEMLLRKRDARIARGACIEQALANRRLEVLSAVRINWVGDLDALEREVRTRGIA